MNCFFLGAFTRLDWLTPVMFSSHPWCPHKGTLHCIMGNKPHGLACQRPRYETESPEDTICFLKIASRTQLKPAQCVTVTDVSLYSILGGNECCNDVMSNTFCGSVRSLTGTSLPWQLIPTLLKTFTFTHEIHLCEFYALGEAPF